MRGEAPMRVVDDVVDLAALGEETERGSEVIWPETANRRRQDKR